eukprot:7661840-Alexandrium_andersonii.AAC.1
MRGSPQGRPRAAVAGAGQRAARVLRPSIQGRAREPAWQRARARRASCARQPRGALAQSGSMC